MNLIQNLNLTLQIQNETEKRLQEFSELNKASTLSWFNELCFCILTANSKAETAIKIQNTLFPDGFLKKTQTEIAYTIKKHGHRFHNTKAKYIVTARKFIDIKGMVSKMPDFQAREFIVKNIKGLGYKEASHFLRNVGYKNVAIIDRHILRFLHQEKFITQIPKTISKKNYLEFENILSKFGIPQNKLDLMIWAKMTGKVLK
jgi:N-glycosylase/DNA lyase